MEDSDYRLECLRLACNLFEQRAGSSHTVVSIAEDFYKFIANNKESENVKEG